MHALCNPVIHTRVHKIDPIIVSVTIFLEYLTCNLNDLELGLCKVI